MKLPVSESALCFEGFFFEDEPEVEPETASELIPREFCIRAHRCNQCDKSSPCRCDSHCDYLSHASEKPFCCAECSPSSLNLDAGGLYPRGVYGKPFDHSHVSIPQRKKRSRCPNEHLEYVLPTQNREWSSRFPFGLKAHLSSDSGEKPFSCTECSARFKQKSHLIQHHRIHSGEKPFICDGCGAKFRQTNHLTQHQMIHTGEAPYECSECSKRFRQRSNLVTHMLVHTGEKPYRCEKCDKKYTRRAALKIHMLKHSKTVNKKVRDVSFTGNGNQTPL